MSCGVGRRHGLDPKLLWLWCRPAAVTPIQPLAWKPPCAVGAALQSKNKQTNKQKTQKGVPVVAQWLMNPTKNHDVAGSIPGLAQCVGDLGLL